MNNSATSLEKQTIRKVTMRIIPFTFLLYIISYLDRANIGYAALQMNKDLALSSEVFGIVSGIFFIGYFIFEVPSNVMMQRFGARVWIARILITWGIVSVLTGLAQTAMHLYILRFLLGVAEAGFFPGIILYLTYWFRSKEQATTVALYVSHSCFLYYWSPNEYLDYGPCQFHGYSWVEMDAYFGRCACRYNGNRDLFLFDRTS